jgi:uncharacterized protein (TIGR03084 family)
VADDHATLLEDLWAEQESLARDLEGTSEDDWLTPTASRGWDVRDTIAHLADTDEIAYDTCTGGPRALNDLAQQLASPEDVTLTGVLRGRKLTGAQVLAWWRRTAAAERDLLASLEPRTRVPWGLGMTASSLVTARLMEVWAHGLDARGALGIPSIDTARLRHVAWLALRALPYAFTVAGRPVPEERIRVELTLPDGDTWTFGPEDAPARITGPAGELCRLFVQRIRLEDATHLVADGDAAVQSLQVARAFL